MTTDLALQTPPIILNPGPEFQTPARHWQGIPGIERAANGRLWATWYTGSTGEGAGNYVPLVTSVDDGQTWTEPVLVVAPEGRCRAFDPCLWIDPRGRLWLFWAQSLEQNDGRMGVWEMHAGDATAAAPDFSAPRRLCHGVMMNKPTVLSTGEWLLPVTMWPKAKELFPDLADECIPSVVALTDEGENWTRRGGVDLPDRCIDEHMTVERRDGRLWMLVRTEVGVGEAWSTDGGLSWTAGRSDALPGPNSRFFIRRLASGRLLMVNHDMAPNTTTGTWRLRSHLTAWLSDDDGATWVGGLLLDERVSVSYPDGVQAAEGQIYVIYDYRRGDVYGEHQKDIPRDRELLMAVVTEEDILAGHLVSPGSRLRQVVNKVPEGNTPVR
jgi:hypothetical protein